MLQIQFREKVEATCCGGFCLVHISKVGPIDTLAIDLKDECLGNSHLVTTCTHMYMYMHMHKEYENVMYLPIACACSHVNWSETNSYSLFSKDEGGLKCKTNNGH